MAAFPIAVSTDRHDNHHADDANSNGSPPIVDPYGYPKLDSGALRGLAGDFVHLIEPHTESDPIALLIQFLVAFGNVIDRSAHFEVEATKHYCNLFAVLVGPTASARKGTSWQHARKVIGACDEK